MELDLDAVSRVLETLVGAPASHHGFPLVSKIKTRKRTSFQSHNRAARGAFPSNDDKGEPKEGITTNQKNTIENNRGTQELLVSPRRTKQQHEKLHQQHRTRRKPLIRFDPSPEPVLSRVIEASGLGASAVFINATTKGKHQEDKVWTTNLYQTPHPFFVLSSLPKNYLRRELVSHIEPTKNSTGVRIERIRDIALSVLFEAIADDSGEPETPIERLVVSCSNHPRTGYVGVLCVKDVKGTLTRAVIPGSLVGPFIKLTIFPRDVIKTKVLRASAIELAFADTWTERRITKEPMISLANEEEEEEDEVGNTNLVTYPQRVGAIESAGGSHSGHVATPPVMRNPVKVRGSPLVCSTPPISPVEAALGGDESVEDSHKLQTQFERIVPLKVDFVAQAEAESAGERGMHPLKSSRALGSSTTVSIEQEANKAMKASVCGESGDRVLRSLANNFPLMHALEPTACKKVREEGRAEPGLVEGGEGDCAASRVDSVETVLGRKHVSKALIAWSIKRQLLQDKNVMRSLREDTDAPFDVAQPELPGQQEIRGVDADARCSQFHGVSASRETKQARYAWDAVSHWSLQSALRELTTNAKTFTVTIARTIDEVFASLSQSCTLQMLFVLYGGEAQAPASSLDDCFNLMVTIARAERRRGRNTELMFRIADGFACLLHPCRELEMKPQWLMVSMQTHPARVNDCLLEALHLHDGGLQPFRERRSEDSVVPSNVTEKEIPLCKPAVLHSVVDFSCLFETLLPSLRAWLTVGDLFYYGDVHPVLHSFINEGGIIPPTGWFKCVLHGTVRSVLLSLPGTGCGEPREMPPAARRRLACITLRSLVPFVAVWQPHLRAVRVVLSNDHVLHHIELLDGVLLDRRELALAAALSPQSWSKIELLSDGSTPIGCTASRGECSTAEVPMAAAAVSLGNATTTSVLAFQVLSTALRRSWMVVGLSLLAGIPFDEDAFMDTVLRWAYAWPRAIVLFHTDPFGKELSPHLSTGFLEAFAPVAGLQSAIEALSANP
ncbi:hypothetical protein TraAM80_06772 [Trypanosoma rangeli]|uniref:Uncharacterized protein n=1 Tax=Trypanosoma rangeli TaxID=5698 RepID=A0A422N8J5_TRYRA|nr:uncharacterized protein TraAM80_06772 [Trypanosoma rangeli]RNF01773.1 hypothetical protein TraAM80_06772 [Trypanosoma rangeli]|eukprot:RNF01773.1 hypothetical protein TraAM80_06772 [Trypanosoma rangeli]